MVADYNSGMSKPCIKVVGDKPAFVGGEVTGYSLEYSQCGRVLVKSVLDRQILGLTIECPDCDTRTDTQERMPGEPIPTSPVMMGKGTYLISDAIDVAGKPTAIVSAETLAEFHSEVGIGYQDSNPPSELDAAFLSRASIAARSLVEPAVYEHHLKKLPKLAASKNKRHRIVELAEYARTTAELLDKSPDDPITIDGDLISELVSLNSLFDRWKNHPAWNDLRNALANSNDVQHQLTQLLTASYLADNGNGVGIVFGVKDQGRIPDLYVRPTVQESLQVEIKTPLALRGPAGSFTDEALHKIIEDHLNKAASSSGGQLDKSKSGLLAIGAFHLKAETLDQMERISQAILNKQNERKPHLAGVVIVMQTYVQETVVTQGGAVVTRSFAPSAEFRIAKHPGYKGSLKWAS